jgi:hypothetical protein
MFALLAVLAIAVHFDTPPTRSLTWQSDGCAGEQLAVVSGCPFQQNAPFVIRLRMAKGTSIPSHAHPIDENITVLRGELVLHLLGTTPATAVRLQRGDFYRVPAYVFHTAEAMEDVEIQTNGIGPLVTNWAKNSCKPTPEPATLTIKCMP